MRKIVAHDAENKFLIIYKASGKTATNILELLSHLSLLISLLSNRRHQNSVVKSLCLIRYTLMFIIHAQMLNPVWISAN